MTQSLPVPTHLRRYLLFSALQTDPGAMTLLFAIATLGLLWRYGFPRSNM